MDQLHGFANKSSFTDSFLPSMDNVLFISKMKRANTILYLMILCFKSDPHDRIKRNVIANPQTLLDKSPV